MHTNTTGQSTDRPRYPVETLGEWDDNGTMPANVAALTKAVVGHRIVSAELGEAPGLYDWRNDPKGLVLTLDDGRKVTLASGGDCCAYTELAAFLLHPDKVDHVITGVGTEDGFTKWHIYAAMGDVLDLTVAWSCGNPFYYGYGFDILVDGAEVAE